MENIHFLILLCLIAHNVRDLDLEVSSVLSLTKPIKLPCSRVVLDCIVGNVDVYFALT